MTSEEGAGVGLAERLAAAEDISKLKARYFRLMDTKRWADWQDVFAPDALMDMTGEAAAMRSIGFTIPEDVSFVWRNSEAICSAVAGALGREDSYTAPGGGCIAPAIKRFGSSMLRADLPRYLRSPSRGKTLSVASRAPALIIGFR